MIALPTAATPQNSIDYMVLHNADAVRNLIFEEGFEPPEDPTELVLTTKELIRKKGKKVIEKLLALHPDKKAILAVSSPKPKTSCNACNNDNYNAEDNYCGGCGHSNYIGSGGEDSFLEQFNDASDKKLAQYYKTAVKKSNTNPDNKNLATEVQMIWNELRLRKEKKENHKENQSIASMSIIGGRDKYVLMSLVFIAGVLVGSSFKTLQ